MTVRYVSSPSAKGSEASTSFILEPEVRLPRSYVPRSGHTFVHATARTKLQKTLKTAIARVVPLLVLLDCWLSSDPGCC
eukprot:scaffold164644_cov19-Prasinocladus_malaysianus.AAC.2